MPFFLGSRRCSALLICVRGRRSAQLDGAAEQTGGSPARTLCNPLIVIFGETLAPAPSTAPAQWLVAGSGGPHGTVDVLVPGRFESIIRLHAPDPEPDDWWDLYRDLFATVTSVGATHTATPDLALFAIWEGHGFGPSSGEMGWRHPPADEAEQRQREELRERDRSAAQERDARIVPALAAVPRFALPERTYYLVQGSLSALVGLRYPDEDGWRNPDLFWPDDRSWFVATDVDFWSLYVGGSNAFTSELSHRVNTAWEFVDRDEPLPIED